ncbi:MFS general substrate transporter [Meredithblackwellia eburnea MCA 4105]
MSGASDHNTSDGDRKSELASAVNTTSRPTSVSDYVGQNLGVQRVEAIANNIDTRIRIFLFVGVFLVAYAYSIDGTVRYTFQGYATASYAQHSLLATVNVVRSIVACAAQPGLAKLADVFGRAELLSLSVLFYVLGTIVEATSNGVSGFCGGAILYQIGYTSVILLVEVTIGDTTSLRNRVIFSYIPAAPFLINAWVSGNVASATLATTTWRWGIAMWAIIYPIVTITMLGPLFYASWKAKRNGSLVAVSSPFRTLGFKGMAEYLFWELDVVGSILLAATLSLILLPFTLAGGFATKWKSAHIIAMLVIGFVVALPAFLFWESKVAKNPCVPLHLLRERTVIGCLGIAALLNCAWYLQGDYLYAVLYLAFDESVTSATRISSLYSFTSVITGIIGGFAIRYFRRIKPFMLFGIVLFMCAFGILIHFRGGVGSTPGVIGGQVLLGIAGGLFPYPGQALIQAAVRHENLAVITACYLASYNMGSALGQTISGAMWTQILPNQLTKQLGNSTLAASVYADPYTFADTYAVGTAERTGAILAYRYIQRLLCITGLCLSVLLVVCCLITRDLRLGDEQSLENAERFNNSLMEGEKEGKGQ